MPPRAGTAGIPYFGPPTVVPASWTLERSAAAARRARLTAVGASRAARVLERAHRRLDLLTELLELRRDRELLAERLERLIDREARAGGGQLEQDAARLAEVDRLEVVTVDHLGRVCTALRHALAPRLVVRV